jgi:hypothetical protein
VALGLSWCRAPKIRVREGVRPGNRLSGGYCRLLVERGFRVILLCALYRDGQHLPENRKDVYDAALDLLLVRWPSSRRRRRGTDRGDAGQAGIALDVRLNPQELQKLLRRLAYWMVTNHKQVLAREIAPKRVRSGMAGLREDDPGRVLRYLSHGCGLLRELPDSRCSSCTVRSGTTWRPRKWWTRRTST